jgi:hypothetical protein
MLQLLNMKYTHIFLIFVGLYTLTLTNSFAGNKIPKNYGDPITATWTISNCAETPTVTATSFQCNAQPNSPGSNYASLPNASITCSATITACGVSDTATVNVVCGNGLNISTYPLCACPTGTTQSGNTCVTPAPVVWISQSSSVTTSYGSQATGGESFTVNWGVSSGSATSCTVSKSSPVAGLSAWGSGLSGPQTASPGVVGNHHFEVTCTGPGGTSNTASMEHSVICSAGTAWNGSSCVASSCPTPTTQSVTNVSCDLNGSGQSAISGSVTRSITKSASPECAFPSAPYTASNSTYVSDNCVYPSSSCPSPTTQSVTVACDPNASGQAAISGSVTRSITKSAYPSCTFPFSPYTASNSTYVSDNCVYASGTWVYASSPVCPTYCGYSGGTVTQVCSGGTCAGSPASQTCGATGACSEVCWDGVSRPIGTCPAQVPGCTDPGASNYNSSANSEDGSCVYCTGWTYWNGNICYLPPAVIESLTTQPRTAQGSTNVAVSWGIKYPTAACTITATAVCNGGLRSNCTASQLTEESSLNQTFSNSTTDSNDPYGASRSITQALRNAAPSNNPTGTKALGKKTVPISHTVDLNVSCGGVTPKNVRVLITTNNEG